MFNTSSPLSTKAAFSRWEIQHVGKENKKGYSNNHFSINFGYSTNRFCHILVIPLNEAAQKINPFPNLATFTRSKRLPPSAAVAPLGTAVGGLALDDVALATERTGLPDDGVGIGVRRHRFPLTHSLTLE